MCLVLSGQCVGTSAWGGLYPDVRGHILSNLSHREHASAAPVCQELLEDFINCVAQERTATISVAEGAIGQDVVSRFVTAGQRMMCGLFPSSNCPAPAMPYVYLVINAVGEMELMTRWTKRLKRRR